MNGKRSIWKFVMTAVVLSVLLGLAFSWGFSLLVPLFTGVDTSFKEVLPTTFWFGPFFGLIFVILRLTVGKIVEESIPFESKEDFLSRLKTVFDEVQYRQKSETDEVSEWTCVDGVSLHLGSVFVKLGDDSATIVGPKTVVKRLTRELSPH